MHELSCYARDGTVVSTTMERMIGRSTKATVAVPPSDDASKDLIGDLFLSYMRKDVRTKEDVHPSRAINKQIVDWLKDAPDFQGAKAITTANPLASALTSGAMWSFVTTDENLKDVMDAQKKAEELRQEEEQEVQQAATAQDQKSAEMHLKNAEALRQQAQEAVGKVEDRMEKLKSNRLMNLALASKQYEAVKEAQEMCEFAGAWGLDPASATPTDINHLTSLTGNVAQRARLIAKLLGRFSGVARKAKGETQDAATGIASRLGMTRDITRIIPTERAYMSEFSPPFLRAIHRLRLITGSGLPGYQPISEARQAGSFVAVIDESGSMDAKIAGNMDRLSLAIAMAMAIAKNVTEPGENGERRYTMNGFSTRIDDGVSNRDGWQRHLAWASSSLGGGTDYNLAFQHGIENVRKMIAEGYKDTDFMMISDGQATLSRELEDEWKLLHKETGARLIFIGISASSPQMREMADIYIDLSNEKRLSEQAFLELTVKVVREMVETSLEDAAEG